MTPEWHRAATSNARVETGRRPLATQIFPNLRCQLMAGHIRASPIMLAPMNRRTFLQATAASAAFLAFSHNSPPPTILTSLQSRKKSRSATTNPSNACSTGSASLRLPPNTGAWTKAATLPCACCATPDSDEVTKIPTDGQPGIFATLDAGAPRTLGLYFMYDVKQVDPAEWSSPPFEAALMDKPGLGKVRDRPRSGKPERSGGLISGGTARDSRRRPKTSGESCVRGGRRRRNRFAALPADRASSRRCWPRCANAAAFTFPPPSRTSTAKSR